MREIENKGFTCEKCSNYVLPLTNGSYRNHCPYCLYSKHLDIQPGDRLSTCHGLMRPISLRYHAKKGYQIKHECEQCGHIQYNKIAYNCKQEDDAEMYQSLMFE